MWVGLLLTAYCVCVYLIKVARFAQFAGEVQTQLERSARHMEGTDTEQRNGDTAQRTANTSNNLCEDEMTGDGMDFC